jgi:hypothetical protein
MCSYVNATKLTHLTKMEFSIGLCKLNKTYKFLGKNVKLPQRYHNHWKFSQFFLIKNLYVILMSK